MRLLKKIGEDAVYIWTEALGRRSDMLEVGTFPAHTVEYLTRRDAVPYSTSLIVDDRSDRSGSWQAPVTKKQRAKKTK